MKKENSKIPWWKPGEGFKLSKTVKKFLVVLLLTMVTAGINYILEYLQVAEIPPEYTIYIGLTIAILEAVRNLVKHWKDEYEEDLS